MLPSQPPVELDCFVGLPSKDNKLTFRTDLVGFGQIVDCLSQAYDQNQQRRTYVTIKGQHLWATFETIETLFMDTDVGEEVRKDGDELKGRGHR